MRWNLNDWLSLATGFAIGSAMFGGVLMFGVDGDDAETISKFMAPLATLIVGAGTIYFVGKQVRLAHIQATIAARQASTARQSVYCAVQQVTIAEANSKIAEKKFKADVFKDRYKAASALISAIKSFSASGQVFKTDFMSNVSDIKVQTDFLFGDEVESRMTQLLRWCSFYMSAEVDLQYAHTRGQRIAAAKKRTDLTYELFEDIYPNLIELMTAVTRLED